MPDNYFPVDPSGYLFLGPSFWPPAHVQLADLLREGKPSATPVPLAFLQADDKGQQTTSPPLWPGIGTSPDNGYSLHLPPVANAITQPSEFVPDFSGSFGNSGLLNTALWGIPPSAASEDAPSSTNPASSIENSYIATGPTEDLASPQLQTDTTQPTNSPPPPDHAADNLPRFGVYRPQRPADPDDIDAPAYSPTDFSRLAPDGTSQQLPLQMGDRFHYTVQEGDSLQSIAQTYGIPLGDLLALNNLSDPNSIKPGQDVVVPAPGLVPRNLSRRLEKSLDDWNTGRLAQSASDNDSMPSDPGMGQTPQWCARPPVEPLYSPHSMQAYTPETAQQQRDRKVQEAIALRLSRADGDLIKGAMNASAVYNSAATGLNGGQALGALLHGDPESAIEFGLLAATGLIGKGRRGPGTGPKKGYRKTFFDAYPELEESDPWVHHRIPQTVLDKYPGLFSREEIHSLENLQGIPQEIHNELHLSKITPEWNAYFNANPKATRRQILKKAAEMDAKYGARFVPPVTGAAR